MDGFDEMAVPGLCYSNGPGAVSNEIDLIYVQSYNRCLVESFVTRHNDPTDVATPSP